MDNADLYTGDSFQLKKGEVFDLGHIDFTPPGAVELWLTVQPALDQTTWKLSAARVGGGSISLELKGAASSRIK